MENKLCLDFLFMRGSSGGFENILNRTTVFFAKHNVHIRYIQLAYTGVDWAAEEAEFICFNLDPTDFRFAEALARYADLLKQGENRPSLIFASGWPYMALVAGGALAEAGLSVPVAAWPHGDEKQYAETHVGDFGSYQFASCCFAISDRIAADFRNRWPDKPVYRVNNSYSDDTVCYSEDRNTRHLAYVGRLADVKMVETILYAMKKTAHPWELTLVGDGPYRE